jgi:hypothetical protein
MRRKRQKERKHNINNSHSKRTVPVETVEEDVIFDDNDDYSAFL